MSFKKNSKWRIVVLLFYFYKGSGSGICTDFVGRKKRFTKLESTITDRFLSLADEEFVYNVDYDIQGFIKNHQQNSILLFPPVNNYRRFLIHKTCEKFAAEYDLVTFSVGQGSTRRTVICHRKQLLVPIEYISGNRKKKEEKQNNWRSENLSESGKRKSIKMGVEKTIDGPSSRLKKSNSVDVYIPPALRRNLVENTKTSRQTEQTDISVVNTDPSNCLKTEIASPANRQAIGNSNNSNKLATSDIQSTASSTPVTRVRRERRPDRAVYVPRARRSLTTPPQMNSTLTNEAAATAATTLTTTPSTPEQQINSSNISESNKTITTRQSNNNIHQKRHKERDSNTNCTSKEKITPCETTKDLPATIFNCEKGDAKDDDVADYKTTPTTNTATTIKDFNKQQQQQNDKKGCDNIKKEDKLEFVDSTNIRNNHILNNSTITNMAERNRQNTALRIEDVIDNNKLASLKDDTDVVELQRASKEINRSNRRIIKQTFNSDILEIPEKVITRDKENGKEECEKDRKSREFDPENDDWDSMFDDNGECVDPKILEELNASVGKVKIETPKTDYSAYHIKQSILNEEEFPHVLEVSNFPVEFKTQDLMMLFSMYKESGFDIKWVDDTHALAVFSSSRIAAEVLAMGHPFVLLKPLAEATIESRTKAKKCSSSLQPYRPRPETCAALARRLVTGALGVRLKTAAQERENEKRVLREAKERKLLAAKQRDEAWES